MHGIRNGDHRKASASWRKPFKREWKKLRDREVDPKSIQKYHTNPAMWTCACEAFLSSRFLICKHIIHCYDPIAEFVKFFSRVRRQRSTPFWVDKQLVLRQEYKKLEAATDSTTDCDDDLESDIDPDTSEVDKLVGMEDEPVEMRRDRV